MITQPLSQPWPLWQKIIFRILFLFLLFFTLEYLYGIFATTFGVNPRNADYVQYLSFLNKPFYWLDTHLYHIRYDPKRNKTEGGDAAFGVVYYISVFISCLLFSTIWGWFGRKRTAYSRLNYWFRVYLRYAVAIIMLGYGIDKIIPIQMPYPNAFTLLGTFGDQSRNGLLWNFMGASPGYQTFTGICEITASMLLLFRRSYVLGCLLMCTVLINVVALNIFYNVNVKIFSSLLLVCVIYLLAPFFQKFIKLFFYEQEVSFAERHYHFQSKKTKYILNVSMALLISIFFIRNISGSLKSYNRELAGRGQIYEVTSFVTKDSLPANVTDTINWKRLVLLGNLFDTTKYAIVYYDNEEAAAGDGYYYNMDSAKKTFTIRDISGAVIHHYLFNYDRAEKGGLTFTGKFKDYDVKIKMKPVMDSMYLNKEKIKLVQGY